MEQLNLPPYDVRLKSENGRQQIFDVLRRRYVALTPEEWVRQHFVHFLLEHKGYPKGLLCNEMELKVGEKKLRCDTLLYNKALQPQMIIEYKAESITITEKVITQIMTYNMLLHVDYLIVSNGNTHLCMHYDTEKKSWEYLSDIPLYNQLKRNIGK